MRAQRLQRGREGVGRMGVIDDRPPRRSRRVAASCIRPRTPVSRGSAPSTAAARRPPRSPARRPQPRSRPGSRRSGPAGPGAAWPCQQIAQLLPGRVEALAERCCRSRPRPRADRQQRAGPRASASSAISGPRGSSRLTTATPSSGSSRVNSPALAAK